MITKVPSGTNALSAIQFEVWKGLIVFPVFFAFGVLFLFCEIASHYIAMTGLELAM